jgi:putative SOS response-associated peptidase YedK
MCGRFVIELSPDLLSKVFGVTAPPDFPARYNIAPTQHIPVIRQAQDGTRQLDILRWGLVPSWSKELSTGMINARSETVNEKPSFRNAFRHRRCIIPASGFYEWQKVGNRKIPYYVFMKSHEPMPFAGIWEAWKSPEGQSVETCAILTAGANATVAKLHDRMPVILKAESFNTWLDTDMHDPEALTALLAPCSPEAIVTYPVSTLVNGVAHDSPECIKEVK